MNNQIKAVQFKNMLQINLDGSKTPVMGLHRDQVVSFVKAVEGLVITLKRNNGIVLVPEGNIACYDLDLTVEQLQEATQAQETAALKVIAQAAAAKLEREAKALEDAAKPKKRRTINDM